MGARICILGEVHVRGEDDKPLDLGEHSRLLLLALAVRRGQLVAKSALSEMVWGEDAARMDSSGSRLRMAVSRLRGRLAEAGLDNAIGYSQGSYRLDVRDEEVDADAFATSVEAARQIAPDDPETAVHELAEALAHWRGDAFGELADRPWAVGAAARLNELRAAAEEDWASLRLALGEDAQIVDRLRAAALAQPLREQRWAQLATAYYRLGQQTDALRALHEARRHLREEVGIEPGPQIRRLERAIFEQHPGLDDRLTNLPRSVVAPAPIGRDEEIQAVIDLLRHNRVVNIIGLGGVGKTTLARTVQTRLSRGLPGIVATLDGLLTSSEVVARIAEAVGLGGSDEASLVPAVAGKLRSTALLVLDGAERCADSVAAVVDELAGMTPNLRVLVTSRVALGAIGEVRYVLEPLDVGTAAAHGPAVTLFLARAGMSSTALDGDAAEAVVRACTRAAGLPLAIELIASSLDRYGLYALDAAVDEAAAPVERSLITALDVVPYASRRLLLDISLLPDGVSLATAAALADVRREDVRVTLGPLAQLRLLEAATDPFGLRYRTLTPIREAITSLDIDSGGAASSRILSMLTSYGVAFAPVGEPKDFSALSAVEAELGNIRHWLGRSLGTTEGLELATSCSAPLAHLGAQDEALRWLEQHRLAVPDRDDVLEVRSRLAMCNAKGFGSGPVASVEDLSRAAELAEKVGALPVALMLQGYLAIALGWAGEISRAIEIVTAGEAAAREMGRHAPWYEFQRRRIVGMGLVHMGDLPRGIAELGEVANGFDAHGYFDDAVMTRYVRASAARALGDMALARSELVAAKSQMAQARSLFAESFINVELAQIARSDADPEAIGLLEAAIAAFDRSGNLRMAAVHRQDLAQWRIADGDEAGGRRELRAALPVLIRVDPCAASIGMSALAGVLAASDRDFAAVLAAKAAAWLNERTGTRPSEAAAHGIVALAAALGEPGSELADDDELIRLIVSRV